MTFAETGRIHLCYIGIVKLFTAIARIGATKGYASCFKCMNGLLSYLVRPRLSTACEYFQKSVLEGLYILID